jgi:hypothetical protein
MVGKASARGLAPVIYAALIGLLLACCANAQSPAFQSIQECGQPVTVFINQSISCPPFSLTVTGVFSRSIWAQLYYNGTELRQGNWAITSAINATTESFNGLYAKVVLGETQDASQPGWAIINLTTYPVQSSASPANATLANSTQLNVSANSSSNQYAVSSDLPLITALPMILGIFIVVFLGYLIIRRW